MQTFIEKSRRRDLVPQRSSTPVDYVLALNRARHSNKNTAGVLHMTCCECNTKQTSGTYGSDEERAIVGASLFYQLRGLYHKAINLLTQLLDSTPRLSFAVLGQVSREGPAVPTMKVKDRAIACFRCSLQEQYPSIACGNDQAEGLHARRCLPRQMATHGTSIIFFAYWNCGSFPILKMMNPLLDKGPSREKCY